MSARSRALLQIGLLAAVAAVLIVVFPKAFRFVELAARELRYLWWLVLLAALAVWLIWGIRRKP